MLAPNEADTGKTSQIIAKKVGLSRVTYERAKTILEKAPEQLKEKVRRGDTSIAHAYKEVIKTERQEAETLRYR